MHDDIVAIEILPESEWTCPSSLVIEDVEEKPDEDTDKDVSYGLTENRSGHSPRPDIGFLGTIHLGK